VEGVFGFSEPVGTLSTTNRYPVMKIITCQHEWVKHCQLRYRVEPPTGYHFEDAHYPQPKCKNGVSTITLWYPDHVVHGALQTLNLQHPCMHGYRVHVERDIVQNVYPEYLGVFEEAYTFCQKFASEKGCAKAGKVGGKVTKQRGVGIFDPVCRVQAVKKSKDTYTRERRGEAMRKRAQNLGPTALSEIARKTNLGRMKPVKIITCEGSWLFESLRQASRELGVHRRVIKKSIETGEEVKGLLATYTQT
jgi:hypothetical protein